MISRATLEQLTEEHARRASLEIQRQHIAEKFLTDEEANLLTNMRFVLEQFAVALSSEREQDDCAECGHNPLRRCRTCDSKCATCEHEGLRQRIMFTADYESVRDERDALLASSGIAVPAAPKE